LWLQDGATMHLISVSEKAKHFKAHEFVKSERRAYRLRCFGAGCAFVATEAAAPRDRHGRGM